MLEWVFLECSPLIELAEGPWWCTARQVWQYLNLSSLPWAWVSTLPTKLDKKLLSLLSVSISLISLRHGVSWLGSSRVRFTLTSWEVKVWVCLLLPSGCSTLVLAWVQLNFWVWSSWNEAESNQLSSFSTQRLTSLMLLQEVQVWKPMSSGSGVVVVVSLSYLLIS